ncbi:hypothetical protein [Brevibacillus dissolubilis]|nr:hypothetical protein [Brevibacillus dissolubilis]
MLNSLAGLCLLSLMLFISYKPKKKQPHVHGHGLNQTLAKE